MSRSSNADSSSSDTSGIFRSALLISVFTLISRVLGAVRDLLLTHLFGASGALDAFIQAFTIPNVLRRLTAEGAMTLAFIPVYTEIRQEHGTAAARIFAQRVLALVLGSTLILTALGMLFSPQLVYLFAAGFASDAEQFELTVSLTRWMFPYLIAVSVVAWAMGVLNAEKHFTAPAAAPIFLNLGIIGMASVSSLFAEEPIVVIGWGVLLGGVLQMLLQIPALRQKQQPLRPLMFWKDPKIHQLLKLLAPSLLGVAVYQINIIILRNLASFLPTGQVTYYYTANRLTELTIGVFALAITTASFPTLSENTAGSDWKKALETLRMSCHATLMIVLPATAGLIALSMPIIAMMYFHGAFGWNDVLSTARTLQAFAIGIPAIAMIRLLVSMFYALQDTRTPVAVSIITIAVTAGLGFWWSGPYEVQGLALALSVGTWFQCACLWWCLRWKKQFHSWLSWKRVTSYTFLSAVMGCLVWQTSQQHLWTSGPASLLNWAIFLGTLISAVIFYFGLLWLLNDPLHPLRRRKG